MLPAAAILGALASGALVAAPAPGQSAPATPPPIVSPATPDQNPESPAGWAFVWDDRPSLQWREGFRLDVRLRLQTDFQWSPVFSDGYDFFFALKRVGVRGNVGRSITYSFDREVNVPRPWRDAYVNLRVSDALEIRAGQFKLPFGLDQNTPLTSLDFVYRSRLGSLLSPGRDPGVMVHGRAGRNRWSYFTGVFTHDGRTARVVTDALRVQGGTTFAGRLLVRPFAPRQSLFRTLQVGGATTVSDVPEGLPGLRGVLPVGGDFLLPATAVKGRRVRAGIEALWLPGPFAVKGEWVQATTERRDQADNRGDLAPLRSRAWFASASWIVSGETAEARADDPARPLFEGGLGGVELAVRVERLTFGSAGIDARPSLTSGDEPVPEVSDLVWTVGASWYWNRWVKVQANLIHDRVVSTITKAESRWSQVVRLQLVF
ncbi:MAG TPA: porin [Vicinamibacterales bacterium]|nr:porin [Vicinamibacterales bacterium]